MSPLALGCDQGTPAAGQDSGPSPSDLAAPADLMPAAALTLASINPRSASNARGATITLTGQNFAPGASASTVVFVSPGELRFTLPASARRSCDLGSTNGLVQGSHW